MTRFSSNHDFAAAVRALRTLLRDPDDTKQAFRVIRALGGPATERMFGRFAKTAEGRAILAERRELLRALSDVPRLEALPQGTLGRAYLDFLRAQRLTAEGLVAASEDAPLEELDDERRLFSDRLREMHDLWHVVTGYRGDLIGEAAVLAFTLAQTRNPGVGLIAAGAFAKIGVLPGARAIVAKAFVRGARARWVVASDWESMLARPLADVRRELGLADVPKYAPVYTTDPGVRERLESAA